jgi:hypothetical protein
MSLQQTTLDVLRSVEEATGRPVVVQTDTSLGTLLAKVKMARGSVPAHFVTYNPTTGAADYAICLECGYLLRMFKVPESERFSLGADSQGRQEAEVLVAGHLKKKGMAPPKEILLGMVERFVTGLVQQLRSMPIGLRVDAWIRQCYPDLEQQQKKGVVRQLNDNAASLKPEVRQFAPAKIIDANISMNAAFALFWSRTWADPLLAVPYKSSGHLAAGEKLLRMLNELPDDPASDRMLIEAWGSQVGLTGWYKIMPYE